MQLKTLLKMDRLGARAVIQVGLYFRVLAMSECSYSGVAFYFVKMDIPCTLGTFLYRCTTQGNGAFRYFRAVHYTNCGDLELQNYIKSESMRQFCRSQKCFAVRSKGL